MRKNLHSKILKGKLKEQHLSIVPNSCSFRKSRLKNDKLNVILIKTLQRRKRLS